MTTNPLGWNCAETTLSQGNIEAAISLEPRKKARDEESTEGEDTTEPTRIKQLVDWELVLTADHVHAFHFQEIMDDERWRTALPKLPR